MQIYDYNCLSDYLNDYFWQKKSSNPNFSLTSWGKQIGIPSSGSFSQMINGKRQIPARYIRKFAETLKLNDPEVAYFKELYLTDKSNETDVKFLDKINPLKWNQKRITKNKKILNHPLVFAIKTILDRKLLSNINSVNLRNLLTKDIESKDISESLKVALKENNETQDNNQRLVTTVDDFDINIQKVHEFYLELAKKRIKSKDVEKREYNSYSLNIKKNRIPEAKERIRYFLDSFIEEFNDNKNGDDIYQIGNYFYSLIEDLK